MVEEWGLSILREMHNLIRTSLGLSGLGWLCFGQEPGPDDLCAHLPNINDSLDLSKIPEAVIFLQNEEYQQLRGAIQIYSGAVEEMVLILENDCGFCSHCDLVPGSTKRNSCNKSNEWLSCSHQNSPIVSLMFQYLGYYPRSQLVFLIIKYPPTEYCPDLSLFWGAHRYTLYLIVNPNMCFERTAYNRKS